MITDFKAYDDLVLIFSNDMTKVLLLEGSGKLDGIFYHSDTKISEVDISKKIKEELDLEIAPKNWRIVTTLQNINKIQHLTVMMTFADLEKIKDLVVKNIANNKIRIISIDKIPDNCLPQLRWLIPMAIDTAVFGCEFNQILTK